MTASARAQSPCELHPWQWMTLSLRGKGSRTQGTALLGSSLLAANAHHSALTSGPPLPIQPISFFRYEAPVPQSLGAWSYFIPHMIWHSVNMGHAATFPKPAPAGSPASLLTLEGSSDRDDIYNVPWCTVDMRGWQCKERTQQHWSKIFQVLGSKA